MIYYPPYHSKYNPIECCWAALETYWNGTILTSVEEALQWASNMTWNGFEPMVHLMEGSYEKTITVSADELALINNSGNALSVYPSGISKLFQPNRYFIYWQIPKYFNYCPLKHFTF